jgi:hypothetical protein
MKRRNVWRLGKVLLVGAAIIVATSGIATTLVGVRVPVAEATVAQGKDKDDKGGKKNQGSDDDADHVLNAQVLEINTLKDPPELIVGSVDGQTVVRVLKTDEIAMNGVRVGDYVELNGEKISEVLFEATEISVAEHFKDVDTSNENKSNDNKNKKN